MFPRLRLIALFVCLTALPWGAAVAADSAPGGKGTDSSRVAKIDTATVGSLIYTYVAHPVLQTVTWPVQNILAPGVEFLTWPTQQPIRYFLEENVIDRSIELVSFGESQHLSVYPTISLAGGTSSRTGASLRHSAPFGRDEARLVAHYLYYVNGDQRLRSFLKLDSLGSSRYSLKLAFTFSRFSNATFYQPDTSVAFTHTNRSENYQVQVDTRVWEALALRTGFFLRNYRFGDATTQQSTSGADPNSALHGEFFRNRDGVIDRTYRGFNDSYFDRVFQLGLVRDTRNNENIPVDGSWLETAWYYHNVQGNRDFHEWRGRLTRFYKLGEEQYMLTEEEDRQRRLRNLNLEEFVRDLEYRRLRQQVFSRKVVVLHLYAAQSNEIPGNVMPFYGLQTLGNDTPLRGYAGSRFRHYAVAATSMEYRFPLQRLMDGVLFNEYGLYGESLTGLGLESLKNSWGFGVRVRRPDMFLFRVELAMRGVSGFLLNVNADAPF